jgi:HEAT repeat protein
MTDDAITTPGLAVPFRLDDGLGPNRADILLVMCRFAVELAGQFTVVVHESTFDVAALAITGQPFEIRFAEDFPVRVTDLQVERDPNAPGAPGALADPAGAGRFAVDCQVPLLIHMRLHLQNLVEAVTFRTPFVLSGTIDRSSISLAGRFSFQLEGYGSQQMPIKFGTCDLLLNASSVLGYQLVEAKAGNGLRLGLLGREVALGVGGGFILGLDGLEVRMLDLALEASPLALPGVLRTEALRLALDRSRPLGPVDFRQDADGRYQVAASIPARLSTQLAFEGFAPQPFAADLVLSLKGQAELESRLHLHLREQIEVAIGDGAVPVRVEADLEAEPRAARAASPAASERRELYARLRAWAEGSDVGLLQHALEGEDRMARLLSVDALGRAAPESGLPLLERALRDPAPEVRAAAAMALEGQAGAAPVDALRLTFFKDADDRVRLAALLALAAGHGPEWMDAAQAGLTDASEVLRCQAALVFGRRGGTGAAGPLLGALADANPFVRLCAGMALLNAGREEAVQTIIRLTREDEDICVQMISSITLGQTQDEEARRALQRLLETTQDVFVRSAAFYGLARQERDRTPGAA